MLLIELQVKVTPRVDEKVVLLSLPATREDTTHSSGVTHLPEVTLYIKFPPSYPSHSSPECHVSARWMDPTVASILLDNLRGRFEPCCPVVYEWIMYLQDDMIRDYCQHSMKIKHRREKGKVRVCVRACVRACVCVCVFPLI